MATVSNVYAKTYQDYLEQLGKLDLQSRGPKLGVTVDRDEVTITMFGRPYQVSPRGITDWSGRQPTLDLCVILARYLILCPEVQPMAKDWATFRGLRDTGPLTVYFSSDVERAIAQLFTGDLLGLGEAGRLLGGRPPDLEADYDLSLEFEALPRVPVLLLFNAEDEEFPAKCSVLFERRAEAYLDAECLAMLGRHLYSSLKRASGAVARDRIQ